MFLTFQALKTQPITLPELAIFKIEALTAQRAMLKVWLVSSHVRRLDLLLLKKIAETMGEFVREYCKVQSGIRLEQ